MTSLLQAQIDFCKKFYEEHYIPNVGYFNIDDWLWRKYCYYPFSHHKKVQWRYLTTTVNTYDFHIKSDFPDVVSGPNHSIRDTMHLTFPDYCFAAPIIGYLNVDRNLWLQLFGLPLYMYFHNGGINRIKECIVLYEQKQDEIKREELRKNEDLIRRIREREAEMEQFRRMLMFKPLKIEPWFEDTELTRVPEVNWTDFTVGPNDILPWVQSLT